ncbi:General stress protein CTC [Planctomycetes bacterium Pan216]|uniref:Large ribosomal subunit protein bL25 n=1 Tax=Kolteria novifilia TaxID=2527975 RepID=A0A518B9Z6_9BACT|nr:General stress protein CTC [Planctomycetes bacterium Pan216]
MVESATIAVERREQKGTRAARRLRSEGLVPGIIYGHKEHCVPVTVNASELEALIRHGAHGLLDLTIDGTKESAVIREVQWDVFGREILHIDFNRVNKDERVTIEVPIVLRGSAPGVNEGGVVEQMLHDLELECQAGNLPQQISVNINDLHLDQQITIGDLELDEGLAPTLPADQVVVQVATPEEESDGDEASEGPAEPEVIRREGGEDQGDGD